MTLAFAVGTFLTLLFSPFIWFQITRGNWHYDFLGSLFIAALTALISYFLTKGSKKP
ncbi:Uncharacterised protein [Streptococcus pseudoporcinus]|uniref:Uncharacterized protein n=1 Tax=Streptococcus pseudoporcinus TaxID=361101 RepID=A0A4U9XLI1_9STRE|nr:hypothetical protein [Streptococcus pseudoporcinus]VTS13478.1 Uncharacterised protein [Streptococcus pseudoporcinus]